MFSLDDIREIRTPEGGGEDLFSIINYFARRSMMIFTKFLRGSGIFNSVFPSIFFILSASSLRK